MSLDPIRCRSIFVTTKNHRAPASNPSSIWKPSNHYCQVMGGGFCLFWHRLCNIAAKSAMSSKRNIQRGTGKLSYQWPRVPKKQWPKQPVCERTQLKPKLTQGSKCPGNPNYHTPCPPHGIDNNLIKHRRSECNNGNSKYLDASMW